MKCARVIVCLFVVAGMTGCSTVGSLVGRTWSHFRYSADLAEIRRDTRRELGKQEREALEGTAEQRRELAQEDLERMQLEQELCQANREAVRDRVQSQLRDSVDSKVAFNVNYGLNVGELEVDMPELKKLIEEREKEPVQAPPQLPVRRQPCNKCAEKVCGCGHGLLAKFCGRCRHHRCGCPPEADCGGPEALRRLEQQAVRRPIKPTEIPLRLPVRLTFGMRNPRVTETRIRKEPLIKEPLQHQCTDKSCPNGACPVPTYEIPPPVPRD